MTPITNQSIKGFSKFMTISMNSPWFLDGVSILVHNTNHATVKTIPHKLMFLAKLFDSFKFPVNTMSWPFNCNQRFQVSNQVHEIDHGRPDLFKNMSMIFNFQFCRFMLQIDIRPSSSTSARDTYPNKNGTWRLVTTCNCRFKLVSNVHSVCTDCHISVFSTSNDMTIS